jgi:hypothetical protein
MLLFFLFFFIRLEISTVTQTNPRLEFASRQHRPLAIGICVGRCWLVVCVGIEIGLRGCIDSGEFWLGERWEKDSKGVDR